MGKRKSSRKAPPKKKLEPLATSFKCLFCHHDKAVTVKMDKNTMFGTLNCKSCGQRYVTPINNLSASVDVYYDWVDACENANEKQSAKQKPARAPDPIQHGPMGGASLSIADRAAATEDDEEEDDGGENGHTNGHGRYDEEEEEDDEDGDIEVPQKRPQPVRRDQSEDEDEDEEPPVEKRRRVHADYSDDEEDED